MRRLFTLIIFYAFICLANAQTMHTLVFVNKSEKGRTFDRTEEFNRMTRFATEVCNSLGFRHNLRTHSDSEFTAKMAIQEINSLNVQEGDIVLFYYSGHGVNWDDDQWPHMAFLDEQYHETMLYNKLKEKCSRAKLTFCIAACCNMDSEGREREKQKELGNRSLSANLTKKLFTGFSGKKYIKISSSIRGQYSYSWTASDAEKAKIYSERNQLGAIYGICLRNVLYKTLSGQTTSDLTWNSVLNEINKETLKNTGNKQLPQFKIDDVASVSTTTTTTASQQSQTTQGGSNTGTVNSQTSSARVTKTWVEHNTSIDNIKAVGIHCDFTANHMNKNGGMVVALFYSKDGKILKDINGRYTVDGLVAAAEDFGTHHEFSRIKDEVVYIPYSEIHVQDNSDVVYAEINIYDYKSKKLIATGTPVAVRLR